MGKDIVARGERNNNPGNIERGPQWQGLMDRADMTEAQAAEKRFAVFKDAVWGLRAIAITIITYQDKRRARDKSRIDTVQEIIDRWAPPVENKTDAYAAHVAKLVRVGKDQTINVHEYAVMRPLVEAIARHELGYQPYSPAQYDRALLLAGIKPGGAAEPVTKRPEAKAATAIAAASAGTGAVKLVTDNTDLIYAASPIVSDMMAYAPWLLVVALGGVAAYLAYRAYGNHQRGL